MYSSVLERNQWTAYVAVAVAVLWSLLADAGALWLGVLSVVLLCGLRAAMAGEEENCCECGRGIECEWRIERKVLRDADERIIV